ncbi:MAG TPA: DM13 domain-containing protein, partial [Pilimelia sp.]|nr:DM13 domain-containing protein [Pilimelia sp.]
WKLVTDRTVADAVPVLAPTAPPTTPAGTPTTTGTPAAPGNRLLAAGAFVTHEHRTTGTAQLIQRPDGRRQLVLRDLDTSDGPDLRVWLSDRPVDSRAFGGGRYVDVARLRGNRGDQVYDLPADVDPAAYRSVSIWCKRFAVSFGAAELAVT